MLDSRGIGQRFVEGFRSLPPIPIGSLLALDTTRRPWHGCDAFWADRLRALNAGSKAAIAKPPQCGFHLTEQNGLAVHARNRQVSLRRELNLIHLIRALLDCDVVPVSQYPSQLSLFSREHVFEPVC